jgi:hypothetical protein
VTRSRGILGSTQEVMVPVGVVGAGRYSARMLAAVDHALAFAEKDRPQSIAEWRRELVGDGALSATATAQSVPRPTASAQQTAARDPTPPRATAPPASTIASEDTSAARTSPPPPTTRVPRAALRMGIALLAAIAIAVLVNLWMRSGDETPGKIAALEKQMRDKDAADSERDRKSREQAEAEAAQRKAREQADLDAAQRKAREQAEADAAQRKVPPAATPPVPRPQSETTKRQNESAAKPSASVKSSPPAAETRPPVVSPVAAAPNPNVPAPTPRDSIAAAAATPQQGPPPVVVPQTPATPVDAMADAQRAFDAKRYADALALYRPLAEAGNAQAQKRLGDIYSEGLGVSRDLVSAIGWYEKAALQGEIAAQMRLGALYAAGGATGNYNIAYIWYGTAALLGSNEAKAQRDKVAAQLQPIERETADRVIKGKVAAMAKKP